jgi:hypothetical protein
MNRVKRIGCGVALAVLLSLVVPAEAGAKGGVESDTDASAGITVSGIGFAKANAGAVERAVHDARLRAAVIARELHLDLGGAEAVELPELTQFGAPGAPRRCPEHKRSAGCRNGPTAVAATVTFAIVGGAGEEGTARTVTASGAAFAPIEPSDDSRSSSIKRAVLGARRAVTPEAATTAWRNARMAGAAAGLRLGTIISVQEAPALSYYGSSFYDPALGSFAPGRFCGIYKRAIVRRDPQTGQSRVVRRVPHRRCTVPSSYSVHLEVRYEAG